MLRFESDVRRAMHFSAWCRGLCSRNWGAILQAPRPKRGREEIEDGRKNARALRLVASLLIVAMPGAPSSMNSKSEWTVSSEALNPCSILFPELCGFPFLVQVFAGLESGGSTTTVHSAHDAVWMFGKTNCTRTKGGAGVCVTTVSGIFLLWSRKLKFWVKNMSCMIKTTRACSSFIDIKALPTGNNLGPYQPLVCWETSLV